MIRCPNCNEENPPKFRLCGYCGTPLHAEAPPAPLPPREVRRTVSIVFCDLKDSTALGERLDPEALHEVKDRYFAAMAAEITRHGGKIEKYIGDAIMAVFGLPVQHEDDALRAVRAAAGMREALRTVNEQLGTAYGVQLANRTGVNTGEVVANEDPTADQKLATGDAVNVTARLEQAAPANEVYIGETTWRLVRDAVEVEAVAPLELKGKQERVPAFRLVSRDGRARRHGAAPRHADRRPRRGTAGDRSGTARGDGHGLRAAHHADRRCGHRQVAAGAGGHRARRCLGTRGPRTLPRLRRRHHFLAAARDGERGRSHPRGGHAGGRAREDHARGRRRGRRRAAGRRDRPEPRRPPTARDLLGGAQVLRHARAAGLADRARRRHPLGRVRISRAARNGAACGGLRADPASVHRTARAAREASRVGRG